MRYLIFLLILVSSVSVQSQKKFKNGPYQKYYKNGQLKTSGQYLNNEKVGNWKGFYETGELKSTYSYTKGEADVERKSYFKNGKIKTETSQTADGDIFKEFFGNDKRFRIQKEIGESSWFGFALTITEEAGFDRKKLSQHLLSQGIECRPVVAGNFTKNPVIKWMDYEIHGVLKNADVIHEKALFLGNHQHDIKAQMSLLKKSLDEVYFQKKNLINIK